MKNPFARLHVRLHTGLLTAALLLAGCGSQPRPSLESFDTPRYTPRYASGFELLGSARNRSTLLRIRNPWQGGAAVEQLLFISRDGEPCPEGFEGPCVQAPVHRVVCMSSSHVAMFDALDRIRLVRGVSGLDYISNAYIREHSRCGEVRDVGYDTALDYEQLTLLRPDLVLLYGVTGEDTAVTGKLRELQIPYVYIGDYVEPSPLGKAEWLTVVAELCDCPELGAEVFGGIAERYRAVARKASERLGADSVRPRVLLNTPYRDTWFLPSRRNYMAQLIRDAGGEAFTSGTDDNASHPIDMEQAYRLASGADFWLNAGGCAALSDLTARYPKFAAIPAVVSGRVYNNDLRSTPAGGSDFWESGTVRPDRILEDLVSILHPAPRSAPLFYYRRLE